MNESVSVMSPPATPKRRFAQIAIAVAALLAIGAAAAGAAHLFLSPDVLGKDVTAQIRRTTGFATMIGGSTGFRLFPQPRIEIENAAFSDSAGAVRIDAATFTAYLRILPLLVGRIEMGHATLYRPNIFIALDRKPMLAEGAISHFAQSMSGGSESADSLQLGRIDIVDGHARIETRPMQTADIDAVNMSIDWPSAYASADLNGELTLHGVPISVQVWLSQPSELLHGGQSATTLRLRSDVLRLSTSGRISAGPRVQYIGAVSAAAPSLRKVAELVGYSFPRHGTFADFDLRSDLDFETDSAALTNLQVSVDGNDYEGNFAIENENGLPRFSGTLASDFLDVTPFLTGSPEPNGANAPWTHQALDLSDLRFADLDLRISAQRLRLYDMEVGNAALSMVTKPGLIDLELAEADANQGTLKGRISLTAKDRTLEFHVTGSGKDIDITPMWLGNKRPLSGALNALLTLDSTGTDLDQIVRSLAGRAEIFVADGEIKGTDLAATLDEANPKAAGEPIIPAAGTTAFDRLSFGLRLANGLANVEQGQFSAGGVQLNFAGTADLGHRTLDLLALGKATETGGRRTESTPLSLRLKGSLDALRLFQGGPDLRLPAAPQQSHDLPDDATTEAPQE
jgi:AsmA protein